MSNLLSGIFYNYIDFIYAIGYFGEYITFLITCALIFNQHIYFIFYIIFFILNRVINQYVKQIFKGERPKHPVKFLESDQFTKKKFGMPSGHSQLTFFSIVYGYLVINQFIPWTLLLLIIGFIVMYERYIFRNHTINQLIYGSLFGSAIGLLCYSIVNLIKKI
jgi:membrane-associated phospholipid phosphatase